MAAAVSLAVLVIAIVIANIRKINIGFITLAAAMLLGVIYNLGIDTILSGFNLTLFLRMLAMQALITAAAQNGTLTYISARIKRVCRGSVLKIFPIVLYVLLLLAELAGFNLYSLMLPVLAAIALAFNMNVLKVCIIGILSMLAGCFSAYSVPGIMLYGYVTDAGVEIGKWNIPALCIISYTVLFIGAYFFYGWHRSIPTEIVETESVKAEKQVFLTIIAYAVVVFSNLLFGIDMMISASISAAVLFILGAADPVNVIKEIPYSVLLMLGGTTTLIGVVQSLGGLELFSSAIVKLVNPTLAPAVTTVLAGVMSIFTSASGVVQPALISLLPHMMDLMPDLSGQSMVIAIAVGSYAVATGPFDASGAQILAAYDAVYRPTEAGRLKTFNSLVKVMVVILIYQSILAFAGFYRIQIF